MCHGCAWLCDAWHEFNPWLHLAQNVEELQLVKKISQEKDEEVHMLQSEYTYSFIPKACCWSLLNHSYSDEMQTLKDMIKVKDAELQQLSLEQKERESECASNRRKEKASVQVTVYVSWICKALWCMPWIQSLTTPCTKCRWAASCEEDLTRKG